MRLRERLDMIDHLLCRCRNLRDWVEQNALAPGRWVDIVWDAFWTWRFQKSKTRLCSIHRFVSSRAVTTKAATSRPTSTLNNQMAITTTCDQMRDIGTELSNARSDDEKKESRKWQRN